MSVFHPDSANREEFPLYQNQRDPVWRTCAICGCTNRIHDPWVVCASHTSQLPAEDAAELKAASYECSYIAPTRDERHAKSNRLKAAIQKAKEYFSR